MVPIHRAVTDQTAPAVRMEAAAVVAAAAAVAVILAAAAAVAAILAVVVAAVVVTAVAVVVTPLTVALAVHRAARKRPAPTLIQLKRETSAVENDQICAKQSKNTTATSW